MSETKDYSTTVNLPKTNFSMKANLAQKEPQIIKFWQENKIYQKILEKNINKPKFILHDGPPYANGRIHIGHALNKILKDIVVKYKNMCGFYSPFIPGWDCHGLPIEYQLFKELKITKEQISQVEFRKKAKDYAQKYVEIQKEEFIRLGVFGDWDKPYLTMLPQYEKNIISTFTKLVEEGYIVKRKKPVFWCVNCETSLAEAEVEYEDKTSDSIYVKFPVVQLAKSFEFRIDLTSGKDVNLDKLFILIWTTTPWTLPANLALAIKPDAKYVLVKNDDEYYILISTRLEHLESIIGKKLPVIKEFYGTEIAKEQKEVTTICKHPFIERVSYCIPYENVATDEGTGVIHIAPGHGEEDYLLGIKYGLSIYSPVDNKGRFNDETLKSLDLKIYGEQVFKANEIIIEYLKKKNKLLHADKIVHSYPHCWRCKKPVIFRATEQWFLLVDNKNLRQRLLEEIKKINWIPKVGQNRISSMVELRPDWCLSRQRYWGVPIPAVYCKRCGTVYLKKEILQKVEQIFAKEGSDSWFVYEIEKFLPEGFKCEVCGTMEFEKEKDILDVWYDSSVSYKFLESLSLDINYKDVMYLEGSDQHRGWFQVSLIVSTAVDGHAPYGTVLTHGFVVDGEGRKMSKSLGNVVAPQDIIKHHGAEILRLWTASSDYTLDVRISKEIVDRLIETYRKIRNTIRYILGNLYDFVVEEKNYEFDLLDKYILSKLVRIIKEITEAYENYEFHKVVNIISNFFIKDLSNFYFDVLKDKLYTYPKSSPQRVASQKVLHTIFTTIVPFISPILSFTAEEAWQEAKSLNFVKEESVFLVDLTKIIQQVEKYKDEKLEEEMKVLLEIKDEVNVQLEKLRKENIIGSSLEAEVELKVYDEEYKSIIKKFERMLSLFFIVSSVKVYYSEEKGKKFILETHKFDGVKCPRCWVYYKKLTDKGVCEKCVEALKELELL
jgi:isoleucyl-tRNA synthetase